MSTTITPVASPAVSPTLPSTVDALGREPLEPVRAKTGAVLVATDGEPDAEAAFRVGNLLARRLGRQLDVVTVDDSAPSGVPGFMLPARSLEEDLTHEAGPLAKVRQQASTAVGTDGWRLYVEFGSVARTIVRLAREQTASLIVMGIGKHTPAERLFGSETVARVLREAEVPVLAVHPSATKLPTRALVALDFSPTSLLAARAVIDIVEPPATVVLVHVRAGVQHRENNATGWRRIYETGVAGMLEELVSELSQSGVTVETRVVEGKVTQQLVALAESEKADVVAVGSHGHDAIDRLLLGSVPLQLLRIAGCSVLVAPPPKKG